MVSSCCVVGCYNTKKKDGSLSFHKFPQKNKCRANEWVARINRQTVDGKPWYPSDNDRVCSIHFTESDYQRHTKTWTLKSDAVPSVFPGSSEQIRVLPYSRRPVKLHTGVITSWHDETTSSSGEGKMQSVITDKESNNSILQYGRYFCAPKCINTLVTSDDSRTQQGVRFLGFENPDEHKERCVNLKQTDLTLETVKNMRVCSVPFDPTAYNNPCNIATSRLLPEAVPVFTCFPQKHLNLVSVDTARPCESTSVDSNSDPEPKDRSSCPIPVACFESQQKKLCISETEEDLKDLCIKEESEIEGTGYCGDGFPLTHAVEGEEGEECRESKEQQHVKVRQQILKSQRVAKKYQNWRKWPVRTSRTRREFGGPRKSRSCCAHNCSNRERSPIDPRTQKPIRFHGFPDPLKEADRCSKWIVNLRNKNLTLENLQNKVVCSLHFEETAYNNPIDVSTSRLLPTAIPRLVEWPKSSGSLRPQEGRVLEITALRPQQSGGCVLESTALRPQSSGGRVLESTVLATPSATVSYDEVDSNIKIEIDVATESTVKSEVEAPDSDDGSDAEGDTEMSQDLQSNENSFEVNQEDGSQQLNQGVEPVSYQASWIVIKDAGKRKLTVSRDPHSEGRKITLELQLTRRVEILEKQLADALNSLSKSRQSEKSYQQANKALKRRVKRLEAGKEKQKIKEHQLHAMLDQARKFKINKFVEKLHTCCSRHASQLNLAVQKGVVKVLDGPDEHPQSQPLMLNSLNWNLGL